MFLTKDCEDVFIGMHACRRVFGEECKVFLCLFHVLKAWLENLRKKLSDKSRFREAFEMLRGIVYWQRPGAPEEEKAASIDHLINEFRRTFDTETSLLDYFDSYWEQKKGETLLLCLQFDVAVSAANDCGDVPSI
jgi:hypothetical protein